jgi:hypothetical protein
MNGRMWLTGRGTSRSCGWGARGCCETLEPAGGLWAALGLAEPDDWVADALCAQTDPEVFFPAKGEPSAPAKRICVACPVRSECLDSALARNEPYGVWGGLSAAERYELRRRLRSATAGAAIDGTPTESA